MMRDQQTLLGLHELLTYGLKGMAAYAHHAEMLGAVDPTIDDFCEEVLAFLSSRYSENPASVLEKCMKLGEVNFRVMQMLDNAHTSHYGNPVPTQVPLTPTKGKAILDRYVTVGFGHHTVLSVADKVLGAVAAGQLSHIFVIGGCDNFEKERKYYTEVAKGLPSDTMVLTLGCGKYRFYDHDFGHLANGLPRLLDMGQCNDAYGALVVATKLAEALNTDVNSLPLSLDISWFEQKAVAVLLTLLHLGIRNVRLGPNLPAFVTPDALQYLVEHFNIMPADTKNPLADVDRMMANA